MISHVAAKEQVYHVTVVSNFARAFDKYSGRYDKAALPQSTYPDRFFVLERGELPIGFNKATRLLEKLALSGDSLLVLEAEVASSSLHANTGTGLGRFLVGSALPIARVHWVTPEGDLQETNVEEAYARSLHCLAPSLRPYAELAPRSLSVLPIARACQAACRFCFSESSASLEQRARWADVALAQRWMAPARAAGAQRFVITGGGEPGLLAHASMLELIRAGAEYFSTVVLITNGLHLARATELDRVRMLAEYVEAGLTVLSLSRHHHDVRTNETIMGVDTGTESVLKSLREVKASLPSSGRSLRVRLVCVLQQGGIASPEDIGQYLAFAAREGVDEVCFKELYVSTTLESAYHANPENEWSRTHQVPLAMLTQSLPDLGFKQQGSLPWGAPLYSGQVADGCGGLTTLRVAAYTEPSLYWERHAGVARSWNLMADGTCLVSLEDTASALEPRSAPRRVIPVIASPPK